VDQIAWRLIERRSIAIGAQVSLEEGGRMVKLIIPG
jgi:hypothetical protein